MNLAWAVCPFSIIETIELFEQPGRLIREKLTSSADEFEGEAQHFRKVSFRLSWKYYETQLSRKIKIFTELLMENLDKSRFST